MLNVSNNVLWLQTTQMIHLFRTNPLHNWVLNPLVSVTHTLIRPILRLRALTWHYTDFRVWNGKTGLKAGDALLLIEKLKGRCLSWTCALSLTVCRHWWIHRSWRGVHTRRLMKKTKANIKVNRFWPTGREDLCYAIISAYLKNGLEFSR